MNSLLLALPVLGLLGACDQLSQPQMFGTLGGAAVGAAVTPNNPVQGALIGSAVGLAAGSLIGRTTTGQCLYQRADGSRYTAACQGY